MFLFYLGLMSKKKLNADEPPVTAVTPVVFNAALHVLSLQIILQAHGVILYGTAPFRILQTVLEGPDDFLIPGPDSTKE
jgi:hypothetical protein